MATLKTKKRKAAPKAKPKAKAKARPKAKPENALKCGVCGYRVIVDEACGCAEEHVLICCGQTMAKD